ncbi:hypothetical protein QWY75_05950 [Pontixanthobacter aestiaquae]|uniref:Peptidase propeptide and YPEB domain-containing protein n=1 Tax=Pontixanthobacter aestiaquae TaxID=1509367 RepID=A0A844ZBP2_9SPHN|nr:hypothetical protein [Pontixanthobacter aestiaquae]MDN3645746.1 hypothetical protein [Pontixanthobacter aestiaquae]MXO83259.1 hypothetical protein [Pontixanthobacter aestiaquae]
MKQLFLSALVGAIVATGCGSVPAAAQSRTDQGEARKEMRAGNVLPLSKIESRHVDPMEAKGYQYLGPAYDSTAMAYRLRFIRDRKMIFIDVDARTNRVLRRSQ